jgi:molybdate transport system permease protein
MKKVFFAIKIITFVLALFIIITFIISLAHIKFNIVKELFYDSEFILALFFSIKTASLATLLAIIFGIPSGLFLSRSNSGIIKTIIDIIIYIPIVLPPLVVGMLLLTLFNIDFIKNFYQFVFTTSGAVIAQFFIAFPLLVVISRNSFDMVPKIYEMAAITLGKNEYKAFFDTTFKISLSNIFSGVILTWLRCMGEFGATILVGGGIPNETENIPIKIYSSVLNGDINKGVTISFVLVFLAIICITIVKFFSNKKKLHN